MKKILPFLLAMVLVAVANAADSEAKYALRVDIPYHLDDDDYARERCTVDVYYPTFVSDAPVVVWFHGGGLEAFQKEIPAELKESGLVVVGVNYRLMPRATIDQCIDDAAAAVAWTFAHAAEYNGSPEKIFVAGHSAGGYLTDMIGLDKTWLQKYGIDADSIRGLFPFSAQKLTHFNVRKQQGLGPLQPTIDRYAPFAHMRPDCPPMIIISGDRELEMNGRYEEQAFFWRLMKLQGHPDVKLIEIGGYDHGSMNHPAYHILKREIKRILK